MTLIDPERLIFAKNLKKRRKERGISQQTMADTLGINSTRTYAKYEELGPNGVYPPTKFLSRISVVLDIPLNELFGLNRQKKVSTKELMFQALLGKQNNDVYLIEFLKKCLEKGKRDDFFIALKTIIDSDKK